MYNIRQLSIVIFLMTELCNLQRYLLRRDNGSAHLPKFPAAIHNPHRE